MRKESELIPRALFYVLPVLAFFGFHALLYVYSFPIFKRLGYRYDTHVIEDAQVFLLLGILYFPCVIGCAAALYFSRYKIPNAVVAGAGLLCAYFYTYPLLSAGLFHLGQIPDFNGYLAENMPQVFRNGDILLPNGNLILSDGTVISGSL